MGKVMRRILADGRGLKGVGSVEVGSKVNGIDESEPERVVETKVRVVVERRGRRNWEDQPAPRIRRSTWGGDMLRVR